MKFVNKDGNGPTVEPTMSLFGFVDATTSSLLTMQDVSSVRAEIKAWERSYKSENGREPSVHDIKKLPHIG